MEVEAHHAALLAGTRLVHLAAKGHGVQRDVVTTPEKPVQNHKQMEVEHRLRACECRMEESHSGEFRVVIRVVASG